LEGFIVDHITHRLMHGDATNVAKGLIYDYWPGFNVQTRDKIFRDTMIDIVDALENKVKPYLPLYAWNIWSSQRIGLDVLVTIGRDFRIVEWERLTGWVEPSDPDEELRLLIAEPGEEKTDGGDTFANPDPGVSDA